MDAWRTLRRRTARPGYMTPMLCMSAGWGDAAILVPYVLINARRPQNSGGQLRDDAALVRLFAGRAQQTTDEQQGGDYAKFTVLNGMDYGEWCEPGITPMQAMMNPRKSVGTAYLAYSGRLAGRNCAGTGQGGGCSELPRHRRKGGKSLPRGLYRQRRNHF